jgi:glycine dehydrogenase
MTGSAKSIADLDGRDDFIRRHIGPGPDDVAEMLEILDVGSLTALTDAALPGSIRAAFPDSMPGSRSEADVLAELTRLAGANTVHKSFIGLGYHGTITPPVIQRNLLENPGWYTAYTPYQPEISQGRLEALLNFQTMIMDLTGMSCANASLLDEGTAAAEAMAMSRALSKVDGDQFFVDQDCLPQTIAVVMTRARPLGVEVVVGDPGAPGASDGCFGVLLQYPGVSGSVNDHRAMIEAAHEGGAIVTVAADLLALMLLASPATLGADIAIGNTQRFGVPMGFGGPHAAYFATREAYRRQLPGRIVGVSIDSRGQPAHRLALQTREQHIRREKATSNICTAQVLLAVIAGCYAVYHGPEGLHRIASHVHRLTSVFAAGATKLGCDVVNASWFDTLRIRLPGDADGALARAAAAGINVRKADNDTISISFDETASAADVAALWDVLVAGPSGLDVAAIDDMTPDGLPDALRREDAVLAHPVFNTHRSETDMLRYLRLLQSRDIALDRSMIPLGSCTMKLNAAVEMMPVTFPGFANIHPFAPADQTTGYLEMIQGLEKMLCDVTGFAAVSLQPNAGSQGEYAGLLAIRAWHESRGDTARRVCLIPSSAHGTNPASAVMAGMSVVVVECDDNGNVNIADLKDKAATHAASLAALMVTYPSTHGVYEEGIVEICDVIHDHGGQVYMDGANLNALLGLCRPGEFGPDVAHMNLHKTFCIPHGGGGPGVGPIGVRAHLAPFLPNHPLRPDAGPDSGVGAISAAPWGSAAILPISYTYIALMGRDGLQRATEVAILSANYIARRLAPYYPVLYTGKNGLVAHECILDLRPLKEATGISVDDVAKRLMDYGFHAPTMSFPVSGTLMIEPTESEPRQELDRFCEGMIAIRGEIQIVQDGKVDAVDSVLRHAPHTLADVMVADWDRAYSREDAAFPVDGLWADKYWPPVNRIDNVYGDRHLICSCLPIDAFRNAAE